MTDYPVGQWIGWNGGECPVHDLTQVDVKLRDGEEYYNRNARFWVWNDDNDGTIIAFRIVEPYVEPAPKLECWVNVYDYGIAPTIHATEAEAAFNRLKEFVRCVHMVEADG